MISPHFPPDTSAATHRVRMLAPHLPEYEWEPTVVSVDPRDYESRLDPDLLELVPHSLRVIRCRAWPVHWARRVGIGDLGLRAWRSLYRTCSQLLSKEKFDVVFITIYPSYPALLGPLFKYRFAVPFVLDYQDPWVSAWGETVGGGPNGTPDWKSRVTRWMAQRLEPRTVRAVDAITAVSQATYEAVRARNPHLKNTLCEEIPLGGEPADFDHIRVRPHTNPYFDPDDENFHFCYVGTLLPLGFETLRAVLRAVALLRRRRPEIYTRVRLHFFGTSNQTDPRALQRVVPVAREFGVEDRVTEIAPRIDYLEALTVLTQATAILLLGSSEPHYTASKLYPGLLARRPMLAVFHEKSSVVDILRRVVSLSDARIVTYNETRKAEAWVEEICDSFVALLDRPCCAAAPGNVAAVDELSARGLAGKLAAVLERVTRPQ